MKPIVARLLSPLNVYLAALALAAVLPTFTNKYTVFVANLTLIYILLSIGLNLLLGYTGQLAFVNAALFGVGAYALAILRSRYGIAYGVALPLAALAALVVGVLVALPALRLTGLYLALATVAFAQFAVWVFTHWDSVTGGAVGIRIPAVAYPLVASWELAHYYVCLVLTVAVVWLTSNLLRSRIGRAFIAVRESEVAAEALAIDLVRTKTLAFALSAFYAGLAGALFAPLLTLVVPETYDLFQVIAQFAMVVVGGLGSLAGSIIGAVGLVWLQEALRAFKELQEIAFGGLILLTVLFLPGGAIALIRKVLPGWNEPLRRRTDGP